jgi:hypothetical protein
VRSEEARALDGCQPADSVTFRIEGDFQKRKNQCGREAAPFEIPRGLVLSGMESGSRRSGAVEVAFDHDNGDVILEASSAAEICRAIEDIDRELFRRE